MRVTLPEPGNTWTAWKLSRDIRRNVKPQAIPIVRVDNPLAKVINEVAIGYVDEIEVETLMARGLEEGDAIEVIVKGILA